MEVIPSWPMEANSGVRGRDRAAGKALEGMTDRQTDRHTYRHTLSIIAINGLTVNNAVLESSGSDVSCHNSRSARQTERSTIVGLVGTEWTLFTWSQTTHGVRTWPACHYKHMFYRHSLIIHVCRKKPKHSKAQSTMPTSRDIRDKP